MKKSKKIYVILFVTMIIILTGCNNNASNITQENNNTIYSNETDNQIRTINCTREATAKEGIDVSFNYDLTYQGEYIKVLHATEKVSSSNSKYLDEYQTAYKNIQKRYEGLKYYENNITRDSTTVTNDTIINYEKIDTDRLLEIEGSEDNVIKDGKVKLETWMSFAKKLGVSCNN